MTSIKIDLETPIESLSGTVTSVTVKEPTYAQVLQYGELFTLAETRDGTKLLAPNMIARDAYLDAIVFDQNGNSVGAAIKRLPYSQARKIDRVIAGFFMDGGAAA